MNEEERVVNPKENTVGAMDPLPETAVVETPGSPTEHAGNMDDLRIRIDMRYYRINLHRNTLKAIGDPEYIQLGYQPKAKKLMILGTWVNEQKAVHLHFSKKGSCYVHSKGMLEGIRKVSGLLMEQNSYILKGELSDNVPAVSFALDQAQAASDEEL